MIINAILPVYNDTSHLSTVIQALHNQHLPADNHLLITVVNDGSNQHAHETLATNVAPHIHHLIHHAHNQGRSTAINTGCQHSTADILIILDADCLPQGQNFIQAHLKTLESADISCGKLVANSNNHPFWDKYQQEVVANREREYQNGNLVAFTTANLALKRQVFLQTGGFDILYKHYGFEDRDFLVGCQQQGFTIAYSPAAEVSHDAPLSLTNIAKKMQQAGQFTSRIFRHKYPDIYQAMSYSKIDLQLNPFLSQLSPIFWLLMHVLSPGRFDKVLNARYLPYFQKKKVAKLVSALNFMYGTSKQQMQ